MKKFLADSKMFEFDKFYKECLQNNQPFIKAKKNPIDNNYLVQVDCATCGNKINQNSQDKIHQYFEKEKNYLTSNNLHSNFKGYNINEEILWFDGILPKRLDSFCKTIFDLCSN